MNAAITLGHGVHHPPGHRIPLDAADPVVHLTHVLDAHRGEEAWWSPSLFDGDYRHGANWRAAWALAVDVDYHGSDGKKARVPADLRARIDALVPTLRATLAHPTPCGLRVVAVLDAPITKIASYKRAATALAADVMSALVSLLGDREALAIDYEATRDCVRLFFTPRSTARGETREARIIRIGGLVFLADLLARDPPSPERRAASPGREAHAPRSNPSPGVGVLLHAFDARGWLGRALGRGRWAARCPWEPGHSKGRPFDTSTIVFEPGDGQELGHFHCSHGSCRGVTLADVLACFTLDELARARAAGGLDPDPSLGDFREALHMLRAGRTRASIMAAIAARVAARGEKRGADYAARTFDRAREVYASRLVRVIVQGVYLDSKPPSRGLPHLVRARLRLVTLDGEVLDRRWDVVAPLPGYDSPEERERYGRVLGDIAPEELMAPSKALKARIRDGRVLDVALRDGRIVWARRVEPC